MRILSFLIMATLSLMPVSVAAAQAIGSAEKPLRVMLIPADGGTEDGTKADFLPLFNAITRSSGLHFEVKTGQSYSSVIEGMCAGLADIAWFGPASYIEARDRNCAQLLAVEERDGGSTYYAGLFVGANSDLDSLDDMKGASLALGSSHSASSFAYPLAMLVNAGIDPLKDLSAIRITGSHTNSLLALRNDLVDAAGASFISFERAVNQGDLNAADFRLVAKSDPIPNPPIAMRPGLPDKIKTSLKVAMSTVHEDPNVRPESIRGYGGKQVDRYNTNAPEALFDKVVSTTAFLTDDYQAAILRKADDSQRF